MSPEVKIDEEFRDLIPPLSPDEAEGLEASIASEGCRDALVVWPTSEGDILLDGHHRYEICTRQDVEYRTLSLVLSSRDEALLWIIANQRFRRNLNPADAVLLGIKYLEVEARLAKERVAEAGAAGAAAGAAGAEYGQMGGRGNKKTPPEVDLPQGGFFEQVDRAECEQSGTKEGEQHQGSGTKRAPQARDRAAKAVGVGGSTLERGKRVLEEAPERFDAIRSGESTVNREYKRLKQKEKQAEREAAKASQVADKPDQPQVHLGDALEWLATIEDGSADLLLTDPPYSTDVDDIQAFSASWLPAALKKLAPTGRAYVFVGSYPEEIAAYFSVAMPADLLVWQYRNTMGPAPRMGYKRNWQAILYYVCPDAPPLDCDSLIERCSVQDVAALNSSNGKRHSWQKPDELAERFIRHSTTAGATVLDPFACTGAFLTAAAHLGRRGIGCEIDPDNLAIAVERGCHEV